LPAADLPLAKATLGRNANLRDARLAGQVLYFRQQLFKLGSELLGR